MLTAEPQDVDLIGVIVDFAVAILIHGSPLVSGLGFKLQWAWSVFEGPAEVILAKCLWVTCETNSAG